MTTQIEEGTLIRVRDTFVSADMGALWIVDRDVGYESGIAEGRIYNCKSLATGDYCVWFVNEFEVQDGES